MKAKVRIPTITTSRLILRAFTEEDVDPFHHILGDRDVLRYFPNTNPPSRDQVQKMVSGQLKHWAEHGYGWWAVEPRTEKNSALFGRKVLHRVSPPSGAPQSCLPVRNTQKGAHSLAGQANCSTVTLEGDLPSSNYPQHYGISQKSRNVEFIGWCGLQYLPETEEVEVAYLLGKAYWGKGIATEAAQASLRYGFEDLGLESIVGIVHLENKASQRVLEKLGLTFVEQANYFGMECYRYLIERSSYENASQNKVERASSTS